MQDIHKVLVIILMCVALITLYNINSPEKVTIGISGTVTQKNINTTESKIIKLQQTEYLMYVDDKQYKTSKTVYDTAMIGDTISMQVEKHNYVDYAIITTPKVVNDVYPKNERVMYP